MSSGHKRIVVNTNERAVSPDINRLQSFLASRASELLRYQSIVGNYRELGDGFREVSVPTAVGMGDVYGGLQVEPVRNSSSLRIGSGVFGVPDPDGQAGSSQPTPADPDDSPYKLVYDPGIQIDGVLTVAANAGPGARIDIVECQRAEVVLETATRDIFSTGTGTFTPTSVTKARAGQLTYRVRQGVAGSGMPALAAGWTPLAVAYIPSAGGTNTEDMDFWDVRPLVQDRINSPYKTTYDPALGPLHEQQWAHIDRYTAPAESRISGLFWGAINGMRAGGLLTRGTPGLDAVTKILNGRVTVNHEPGLTLVAGQLFYLWLVFPFGLPRWVRYNRADGTGFKREPQGVRGIPVLSSKAPVGRSHIGPDGGGVFVPASTGLDPTGSNKTMDAFCAMAGVMEGANIPGKMVSNSQIALVNAIPTIDPEATGTLIDDYIVLEGTHMPRNARGLRVFVGSLFTGTANASINVNVIASLSHPGTPASLLAQVFWKQDGLRFSAAGGLSVWFSFDVPRPFVDTAYAMNKNLYLRLDWTGTTPYTTKVSETLYVKGWRFTG